MTESNPDTTVATSADLAALLAERDERIRELAAELDEAAADIRILKLDLQIRIEYASELESGLATCRKDGAALSRRAEILQEKILAAKAEVARLRAEKKRHKADAQRYAALRESVKRVPGHGPLIKAAKATRGKRRPTT